MFLQVFIVSRNKVLLLIRGFFCPNYILFYVNICFQTFVKSLKLFLQVLTTF